MFSDQETSGSSSAMSPQSSPSPYSSPSQQVPQLTDILTHLKCADNSGSIRNDNRPFLKICEQPQLHFRFRYRSEMLGTHGCIFGRSHMTNKNKSYPTVELVNYSGKAVIRCILAQKNCEEHPNQLFEESRVKESDVLPVKGSYKVAFPDMGVIHNSKKEVQAWLLTKYIDAHKKIGTPYIEQQLRAQCDSAIKEIDMNIVRLKFSAHDAKTGTDICEPVFSDLIHNMKSAATNDLKICVLSKINGSPKGGDDVIMLCEKVNKKNIKVRFFEIENGVKTWTSLGIFMPSDVHHQYAIKFRTPPYKNEKIENDVKVFIELFRPKDQRTSEPVEFTYLAEKMYKYGKKRRAESSLSSLTSSSGGSMKSLSELPLIVANHTSLNETNDSQKNVPVSYSNPQTPNTYQQNILQPTLYTQGDLLSDALQQAVSTVNNVGLTLASIGPSLANIDHGIVDSFGQQAPPELHISSSDFERLLRDNPNLSEEDKRKICDMDWTEYMRSLDEGEILNLVPDSGRAQNIPTKPSTSKFELNYVKKENVLNEKNADTDYEAFYTAEDGREVKQILKELVDMMRLKTGNKKQEVRNKLERLFQMRLSNGDTFLHMTLCNNQPSMDYIVKMISAMKMSHLLNYQNKSLQTVLHLAVANDMPQHVEFLVANGCNPTLEDKEGNTAVHYAVILSACLDNLLNAIKTNKVPCDLNAKNHDANTPLHLSVLYRSEASTKLLLSHGADYKVTDGDKRTALHLAAYDGRLEVLKILLEHVKPCDIDMVDGRGNTALQIVCGRDMTEGSVEMVQLLLEKKADPKKHEYGNCSALKLAHTKPELLAVITKHIDSGDRVNTDDEYQSADEGSAENQESLPDMHLYISEISGLLDSSSSLLQLASQLSVDAPLAGSDNVSPTERLLNNIKISKPGVSSATLATLLEKLGEFDVAKIIRERIK